MVLRVAGVAALGVAAAITGAVITEPAIMEPAAVALRRLRRPSAFRLRGRAVSMAAVTARTRSGPNPAAGADQAAAVMVAVVMVAVVMAAGNCRSKAGCRRNQFLGPKPARES